MSYYTRDEISRDGFRCSFGRFYAKAGVECVDSARLKAMVLPKMTRDGAKKLDQRDFVRGQFQHYGLDQIPEHIQELRAQMHREWLASRSDEDLSGTPEWILDKYFLDRSGEPDRNRTPTPVGVPFPASSSYRVSVFCEAVDRVSGLHRATGNSSKTRTVYLGWNSEAVDKAAKEHASKEAKAAQDEEEEREAERAAMHKEYLDSIKKQKSRSPVGEYIVDCDEVEGQWPDQVDDGLTISIFDTENPDIYQAEFDFGVIEGIMLLGPNERALEEYVSLEEAEDREDYDSEDYDSEDDEEDLEDEDNNEEEEQNNRVGSKRKASVVKRSRGRPPKKAKPAGKPIKYFVRLKSRETGEGVISPDAEKGSIKFKGSDFSAFTGEIDLSFVGRNVPFTARMVSGTASGGGKSWSDYSHAAYERARVCRWH
ncbi:hypothetical protein QBC38DRAFT_521393 [Podospora fimiseda]|uniref:Uncharacterized protein n=1 Tax=Podospora fimiseda TaxID=252190 RepID=A0AAN6YPE2_9PEZI|nr:hypothetical protein QBC38DRAFT_521393 [Podospora fimiseda]